MKNQHQRLNSVMSADKSLKWVAQQQQQQTGENLWMPNGSVRINIQCWLKSLDQAEGNVQGEGDNDKTNAPIRYENELKWKQVVKEEKGCRQQQQQRWQRLTKAKDDEHDGKEEEEADDEKENLQQ